MATEVKELHFRIGETAGQLLTTIAREHLLYNYNPEKALDALEGSFGGNCPRELTLAIIKGDMVVLVDTEEQQFIVTEFIEGIHDKIGFEKLNIKEWVTKNQKEIIEDSLELKRILNGLRSRIRHGHVFQNFDYETIFKFVLGDNDAILNELWENEKVHELGGIITGTKKFIEKSMNVGKIISLLQKWYPEEWEAGKYFKKDDEFDLTLRGYSRYLEFLQEVINEFNKLMACDYIDIAEMEEDVQNFVESAREIDKVIEAGIEPVDILQNWSAGWLAPNGDYYALNGEIANMLHNQIADALKEKGIIPEEEINPDSWLEERGWVKIHGSIINFGGCLNTRLGKRNVQMTAQQIKKIYEYGAICHNGMLKMGWQMKPISAIRWKDWIEADPDRVNKEYFEF